MGALLESGLVGNIGLKHLKVIKEDTINKWDKLGFLEGLNGHQKENVAQLFENQASHLINEAAHTDSSGSFETVVFPIVRRVFSKLLANDIVSVQAMNLPIGKLFFFVPKIQERTSTDGHYGVYGAPGSELAPDAGFDAGAKNLYDRFYEDGSNDSGMYDYSKGKFQVASYDNTDVDELTVTFPATGETESRLLFTVKGFQDAGAEVNSKLHLTIILMLMS